MVRFNNRNILAAAILALATTSPLGVVLATPPPDMIEALSAYAAAGVTPTIAAGIRDVHRLVRRVEETPAREEEIVILPPPGHRPYKQLPDAFKRGTRMIKEARGLGETNSNSTATSASSSSSSSMSAASTKAGSKTSTSSTAATSSRSIDSHHYWYIEDSPDQARWRKILPPTAPEVSKRALGHFFDKLQDDFDRTTKESGQVSSKGASSAPTGFKKVSLRARAEASSISPIDSSSTTTTTTTTPPPAAPVSTMLSSMISPAERSASISQAAENLTWYDPTTWPSGIAAEVTQETDSIKDSIRKMNMLSKIGLATLVLVSTICLGFLIYCLCKMNMRRRRRSAAERVAAKMAANPPTRPYGGSATVPMTSTGFSPSPVPGDKKGKRRMSWSRG